MKEEEIAKRYWEFPMFGTLAGGEGFREIAAGGTCVDYSGVGFETISEESVSPRKPHTDHSLMTMKNSCEDQVSRHTWTSFSPRATRSTMRARAALSGFESR